MATTTIGNASTVSWGTTTAYILDEQYDDNAQFEVLEDNEGKRVGAVIYDTVTTATYTAVMQSSATLPAIGATISVAGKANLTVTGVQKHATHKGFTQITINAESLGASGSSN